MIKKIQNNVPWTYIVSDLNGEEIVMTFYEKKKKELQKTSQKEFSIEKLIKTKVCKLYVKWMGYDNSFNGRINMKDVV